MCLLLCAERLIRTAVHSIEGNIVHVWLMDSYVVWDCSVCPLTVGTVFWCHQLVLELIQLRRLLHWRQLLQQHYSFDCDVISTSVDSYGCLCAFSHPVRWRSVACSLASDNRMADLPNEMANYRLVGYNSLDIFLFQMNVMEWSIEMVIDFIH